MDNTGRIYLRDEQKIQLCDNPDGLNPSEYRIVRVIGTGASTVCYEAVRLRDGKTGKLKEFYPSDTGAGMYYSLKRLENGQLVSGKGMERTFPSLCEDYLHAYRELNKLIAANEKNEVLKNFIQNSEILYGCPQKQPKDNLVTRLFVGSSSKDPDSLPKPTVYVWSSGVAGRSFDDYLREIRQKPDLDSDFKLYDILEVMIALTDGIKSMHTAGLLHMDIKPSNFIVAYNSDMKINPSNISLFDVDTFYHIDSAVPVIAGSKGYRAPEVRTGKADNRADIYSLGAVLFSAVVINDEIADGLYDDAYYDDIEQLVRHSRLLKEAEANSDYTLMRSLVQILKKSLAPNRKNRYDGAGQMLGDLKKARAFAQPYALNEEMLNGRKMRFVREEKEDRSNLSITLQKLLYDYPLYETADKDKNINVLVIGCGGYSQKFIDTCLQAGQMKDYKLGITAVSNGIEEDKKDYLSFRPDIQRFVNIDGSMPDPSIAYGSLSFVPLSEAAKGYKGELLQFRGSSSENSGMENTLIATQLVRNYLKKHKGISYVFIALGNDRLNQAVASVFSKVLKTEKRTAKTPVFFVSKRIRKVTKALAEEKLIPVSLKAEITPEMISAELERMSFNTHSIWNSSKRNDPDEELEQFRSSLENYGSSMAFVLSLKYKLHSIGIDIDQPDQAAKLFNEKILLKRFTDPEADNMFNTLTMLEHRRWVLYMAADGWQAPRDKSGNLDLSECVKAGKARVNSGRKHACMVFGTEKTPLQTEAWQANNHEKWNTGRIDPELDELDRMSVQLHYKFKIEADRLKREDLLHGDDIRAIRDLLPSGNMALIQAFDHYVFCLKNILEGVRTQSVQYGRYEKELFDALEKSGIDHKRKELIKERTSLIHKAFIPVIEANLYRDYKAIDADLIEQIPYILTWHHCRKLAMAFEDGEQTGGRSEEIFANAASATVLRPYSVRYYYCFTKDCKPETLPERIRNVISYFRSRRMNCDLSVMLTIDKTVSPEKKIELKRRLDEIIAGNSEDKKRCRFSRADLFEYTNPDDVPSFILDDMKKEEISLYDGSTALFSSQKRNADFMRRISDDGIPYFEFRRAAKTFENCEGCAYLKYLHDDSYLTISDMFALKNVTKYKTTMPDYADDYEKLWAICTGNYLDKNQFEQGILNWTILSGLLEKRRKKTQPLAAFPLKAGKIDRTFRTYYFPSYGIRSLREIIENLIERKIIGSGSYVEIANGDECRTVIDGVGEVHKEFENIAAKSWLLHPYYGLEMKEMKGSSIKERRQIKKDEQIKKDDNYYVILDESLTVERLDLNDGGFKNDQKLWPLLRKLSEENYINQLTRDKNAPSIVSFNYSAPRIRNLLTKAGEILEVYTYYEVLKLGYFDDVATGFEYEWEKDGVSNELDLVLTKGFRTIIAECKEVQNLDYQYYLRLDSLANHFAIGCTNVLIGNTYRDSQKYYRKLNDMHRSRGTQLSITTVHKQKEIIHIAEKLKEIMESALPEE